MPSEPARLVDLAKFAWFDIETVGPCPPPERVEGLSACNEPGAPAQAMVILEAASLDGRYRQDLIYELQGVDQPANLDRAHPFAFLGADGEVFYTANDKRGGALRSVRLSTGAQEERFRSEELIQAAAYDPGDGTVIASFVSADQRADRGIWRINLATEAASRIVGPRTDLDVALRANGWSRRVFITPDSRRIVSFDCIDMTCEARVFGAETGGLTAAAAGLRDEAVYGATDRALIGVFDCPQQPCRISALELDDGSLRQLVSQCTYAVAALAFGSDTAASLGIGGVATSTTCDAAAVLAVDTETGQSRTAWTARSPTERQLQVIQRGPGLGYSAPAGWIALGPGGGFKPVAGEVADPVLLDLVDGGVIPIVTR